MMPLNVFGDPIFSLSSATMTVSSFGFESIGSILISYVRGFHGPQSMNVTFFGDPLTLPVVPPAGQSFYLSSEYLNI